MDDFEKNNELENEEELPEVEAETAAVNGGEEPAQTDIAEEAQETQEAEEAQDAEEAPEAEDAAEEISEELPEEVTGEFVDDSDKTPKEDSDNPSEEDADENPAEDTEDGEDYSPEESDAVFEGGDLQSCEDISEEDVPEDESEELAEEEDPADIPEEELCKRCYARRRDNSVEGFEYCSVCVDEMAATRVSFGAFFYIFIATLCFVIALGFAAVGFHVAKPVMKTGAFIKQHRLSQAMEQFNEAEKRADELNARLPGQTGDLVIFETGTKTVKKYIKLLNTVAGPINAYQVMESAEGINVDKLPRDLKGIGSEYAKIKATDDIVYEMFQEYQKSVGDGAPDYKTLVEKIDKVAEENKDIYKPFIEYYKYYAARIANESAEVQIAHLENIQKEYPDKFWLYLSPLMDLYYSTDNYGKTIECCDKVLELNVNDSSAMIFKARSFYLLGKKDKAEEMAELLEKNGTDASKKGALKAEFLRRDGKFDEAIALCDDIIAKDSSAVEVYRQKAIAQMLKGDIKSAHETLSTAYEQDDLSVELVEMLAITSSKTDDKDMLEEVNQILAYNNLSLSARAQACIDGTLTVEQIFMEGRGDIE